VRTFNKARGPTRIHSSANLAGSNLGLMVSLIGLALSVGQVMIKVAYLSILQK
jgi:hypothetical protein